MRPFPRIESVPVEILQINLGKVCNQTCSHCHVDAGPHRRESMTRETMELCLSKLAESPIPIVDLTGGAPEINPPFRWLVEQCRRLGRKVMVRCNLTILLVKPGLPEFYAANQVEVVASLPCYSQENTDRQRRAGVSAKQKSDSKLSDGAWKRSGTSTS